MTHLRKTPASWALALALMLTACSAPKPEGPPGVELFRECENGPVFTHRSGASGKLYMTEIMGAGVAVLDFDNDGDLDILFVQSSGESKLFRNELTPSGKLAFTDVTAQSGIVFDGYGMGAATADFNNDGFTDLLVTGYDARELYRNNGNGTFTKVGLPQPGGRVWSTSASFTDYDRDGWLDIVILSYVNFSEATNKSCQAATGEPDYCTPRAYSPVAARLYHNEGGDRFTDVTAKSGIDRALGPGLGVSAADFNDDGWPDLFVANDTAQNHLWINQRNGTFKELGLESGAAFSEDGLPKAGMGVAVGDADSDADEDLFVVNLMREGATLYRRDGLAEGLPIFVDATRRSRLFAITHPFTGFGTEWFDFDNDGHLDLFIANGAVTLREEQRGEPVPFKERNLLIRNAGDGTFLDVTAQSGRVLQLAEVTRGAAFGDLDNDGDTDIVITNNNGPARLLLNHAQKAGWLDVVLEGNGRVNRDGIGARVSLYRHGRPPLVRRIHTDSSYCSASDRRAHFGLGDGSVSGSIEVAWPDGLVEHWDAPSANRVLHLTRGTGRPGRP